MTLLLCNIDNLFCCPALELFSCLPPLSSCPPLRKTVRLLRKKLQNATNDLNFELTPFGAGFPDVLGLVPDGLGLGLEPLGTGLGCEIFAFFNP